MKISNRATDGSRTHVSSLEGWVIALYDGRDSAGLLKTGRRGTTVAM